MAVLPLRLNRQLRANGIINHSSDMTTCQAVTVITVTLLINTGTNFFVAESPVSRRSVFKFQVFQVLPLARAMRVTSVACKPTPAPALHHSRCLHTQPAHCMLQPPPRPISQPGPHDNALHRCNQQPAGLTRHSFAPSTPFLPTPHARLGQALAARCIRRQAPCPPSKSPSRAVRPRKRNAPVPAHAP